MCLWVVGCGVGVMCMWVGGLVGVVWVCGVDVCGVVWGGWVVWVCGVVWGV